MCHHSNIVQNLSTTPASEYWHCTSAIYFICAHMSGFIDAICVGACVYHDQDDARCCLFSPQDPSWCSSLVTLTPDSLVPAPAPSKLFSASKIELLQKCQIHGITCSFGDWLFPPPTEFPGNSSSLLWHLFFMFIDEYSTVMAWFISSFTYWRPS